MRTYFIITDLSTNKITVVKNREEVSNITGWNEQCFKNMDDGEKYYLSHYGVECSIEEEPKVYYKNLWNLD